MLGAKLAYLISELISNIDQNCRNDLTEKLLVSERDYVSRLTTHITYPFGPWFPKLAYTVAQTLPPNFEQKFGADAVLIFKSNNVAKIGMFESKWPRVIVNPSYKWDDLRDKGKPSTVFKLFSHFTDQIIRQNNWTNEVAIWEMFFYEGIQGTYTHGFNRRGSSCFWSDEAFNYVKSNWAHFTHNYWEISDLNYLFTNGGRRKYSENLQKMVYKILLCEKGKRLPIDIYNSECKLKGRDGRVIIVPLPIMFNKNNDSTKDNINKINDIHTFMLRNGVSFYIYIDLDLIFNS
ncbi:hypothetical protein [Metabacillus indicus]|uniref:Uncharacterized protein n=1 Tax=Metabacillus indicus TaxID=246786 RepID=A0A084GNJ0_METID|nr:hypothetical protein [Metabacillus indicus]KEZ48902.1 hypothetical protein GS18_0215905 [Metabacillus indicus]KEZ49229.1 hypothetical protein AZ46_0214250 [Metabacillus indicus LMG 22858]